MVDLAERLRQLADNAAQQGNSVMADAYLAMAQNTAADAEAGAARDKVLWLFRTAKRATAMQGIVRQQRRMRMRIETGEVLWHSYNAAGTPMVLAGRGQEYMFSSSNREVDAETWDQIRKYDRSLHKSVDDCNHRPHTETKT